MTRLHFAKILVLFLLQTTGVSGQTFVRTSLPNQLLLPVSRIVDVLQDSEGYMWYATLGGGLCRDNGFQIDFIRNNRRHPNLLSCNDIISLQEDTATHSILFLTSNGAYELQKGDYSVRRMDDKEAARRMRWVDDMGSGASQQGQKPKQSLRVGPWQWTLFEGRLQLVRYNADGTTEPQDISNIFPEQRGLIDGIFLDHDKRIWVYGQSPHTFIISAHHDVVEGGCTSFYNAEEGKALDSDRAVQPNIYCQMTSGPAQDDARQPWLWAWLWRKPMTVFNRLTGEALNVQEACPDVAELFFGFSRTADGNGIWTGSDSGQLVRLWIEEGHVRHEVIDTMESRIIATADAGNGMLWVGTALNLYLININTRVKRLVAKGVGCVTQMHPAHDGWMYFTIEGKGLARANTQGKWQWVARDMVPTDVVEDHQNRIWVASKQGEVFRVDTSKIGSKATDVLQEVPQAGNENGDIIYMMEADSMGHIWVLSDQRLKEYNPKTGAVCVRRATDPDIRLDCFQNICLTDGRICLAGLGGYRLLAPNRELDNTHARRALRCALSSYSIGGEHHFVGLDDREIVLQPSDVTLELAFTAFNIVERDEIQFACKLEGWDDWKVLPKGQNSLQYINIQKGEYRLLLRTADAYGRWSEPQELISIVRLPAWWETWWFKTLSIALTILLAGYAFYFYIIRRFRRRIFIKAEPVKQASLMGVSQADEAWLQRALEVVERHLDDTDFSIERMSQEMCMSRMNLYRKMQTLTGQSPSEYLRTIRLKKAAAIILAEDCPLSEVADRTGFSTPAYFSKCFRDMYGHSPSAYRSAEHQ